MAKTFQDLLNKGQAKVLGIVSIVPMDDWNTDTQYQKLNLVRHNGAAYLAKGGSKNVEPGVTQDWQSSWMLVYLDGILSPDGTYPNLTAGRVMHALAWGNKNYDGSSAQTITAADLGLADVYKPQGSIAFASLPATPNESNYGYVWNISDDFTTDSRFLEGAGKACPAGTNVGVIEQDGVYYYDILGAFMDLSNYAEIDGAYPTLGAGYLAKNIQVAAGANTTGWWKIGSIDVSKRGSTGSTSTVLFCLGLYSHVQGSGIIEINGRMQNGALNIAASPLYLIAGDLPTDSLCLGYDGTVITLYQNLGAQYTRCSWTILEDSIEATSNVDYFELDTSFYGTSVPSGAVYAVNRNFARPLFIANQTQAKTPTVNTDMTLDGGVSPEGSLIGDEVIFYCTDGSNSYTCTGNIKSISGTTPTVTITGVVIQTISEAEHLPNNYIYAGGSSDPKWYKIATITNAPNLTAASLLLSINGIFATQDNQYGAETGQIEFDAANASGTYSCSATLNYGNINTNNVCVVQNGSTAELYYHFDSNYQAILVTVMSFYGGSTASYELTNEGVSSAPSNAIYAVNRNVAAKVENALTIIKDGVSTVYDGSEAKNVEIPEGGITVIEIPANESDTLTSEQLQQVKNNPQNTVLRRTVSPEMNEIYCFDSVNMTQGADSTYTFRNVTSMAQNSLTLQAISVNLSSGLWVYSSVQTSTGGGGGSGITIVTIPQDGVSTNPVMSGTIELASPENTVIKIYNGEDNDGARYTYSILTSFDENASGDVPEYVYSGEDYIVTCTKSNGNTYNYTLTETPTQTGGGTQLYRHARVYLQNSNAGISFLCSFMSTRSTRYTTINELAEDLFQGLCVPASVYSEGGTLGLNIYSEHTGSSYLMGATYINTDNNIVMDSLNTISSTVNPTPL